MLVEDYSVPCTLEDIVSCCIFSNIFACRHVQFETKLECIFMRGMFKFGEEDFVAQITNVLGRLTDVEHYHL